MRHNLGGFLTLLGAFFLAIPIFRWGNDPEWKKLRQPERFFYKLFGDKSPLVKAQKRDALIPELLENKGAKRPWSKERMLIIGALFLLLAGFLFSLDYRALSRCWECIF